MPQFQMEVSLGGVILIIGQALTFLAFVWKRSGIEAEQRGKIDQNTQRIVALERDGPAECARLEADFDAKISTLSASLTLMRENHHELREHLATNYMKREEIAALERRVVDGQNTTNSRIGKIEDRLDTMQKTILDAIAGLRSDRRS